MRVVMPCNKPRPYETRRSHARARHDYAAWHPDLQNSVSRSGAKSGLPWANRSKFHSGALISECIARSADYPALEVVRHGKVFLVTAFDAGFEVGYDVTTGKTTSSVTIVTTGAGEVITAYPGCGHVARGRT